MYALFQSLANSAYITGETRLDAIIKELRCLEQDSKHFSNTDDIQKETNDTVKAAYGLIGMIHTVDREYKYGDFTLLQLVSVFLFKSQRVWKFGNTGKEVYCIKCIDSVELPTKRQACEDKLRKLVSLLWLLKRTQWKGHINSYNYLPSPIQKIHEQSQEIKLDKKY